MARNSDESILGHLVIPISREAITENSSPLLFIYIKTGSYLMSKDYLTLNSQNNLEIFL